MRPVMFTLALGTAIQRAGHQAFIVEARRIACSYGIERRRVLRDGDSVFAN